MAAILVRLDIHDEITTTQTSNSAVTAAGKLSEHSLHARFLLTPDGNREAQKLGVVRLRIDCEPNNLQDMNRADTAAWLAATLRSML